MKDLEIKHKIEISFCKLFHVGSRRDRQFIIPSKPTAHLNSIQKISSYRKLNTNFHNFKDQLVKVV